MKATLDGKVHRLEYDDGQLYTTFHNRAECVVAMESDSADNENAGIPNNATLLQTICDKVNRHDQLVLALRAALAACQNADDSLHDFEIEQFRQLCAYVSPSDWAAMGEIMRKRDIPGDQHPEESDAQMCRRIAAQYGARMTTREREVFEFFGGPVTFGDVRRAFPDGEDYHTGGGCMAFYIPLGGKYYALITTTQDSELPEDSETDEVTLGIYHQDDGGLPTEEDCCEDVAVADIAASIAVLKQGLAEADTVWHD